MGKKKPSSTIPAELLDQYDRLIETILDLKRKGDNTPYTSLNGHMFSFLGADGRLGMRLPQEARETFLQKYNTQLCVAYGTVLKEYVSVPNDLLANTEELKEFFATSYAYVGAMKPKPSKKAA